MMCGSLSFTDLNIKEQNAVTQLKQAMIGLMDQDMFEDLSVFVRFLRARDLNVNAAETMLKNHLEWRKAVQVDSILTDYTPKEVLVKYMPFSSLGFDKGGCPLLYFDIGHLDSRGVLKAARKIDMHKAIIKKLEYNVSLMQKQSYKLGKHIDQWTMIVNFDALPFSVATHKQTLETLGNLIMMYESNYPERLKRAFFINASIYFAMAFAVLRNFLSGPTIQKIKIFGKEGWKDEILEAVDPDVLPAFLGGNRTDPDGNPLCKTVICHGGSIPKTYYVNKKEITLAHEPGVEKMTVTRMSKTQLTLEVTEPGSHIEWEFETKNKDIGFSLLYKENNLIGQLKIIIPKQRIETDMSSETGMFKCDKVGILYIGLMKDYQAPVVESDITDVLEFDNTYSWIYQKEIFYKVSVVTPHVTSQF